jgi:hypothetical protein
MPNESEVTEVTAPVDFMVVEDRLHFTLTSGQRKRTFSITFHKARNAAHLAVALLDQEQGGRGNVSPIRAKSIDPRGHG